MGRECCSIAQGVNLSAEIAEGIVLVIRAVPQRIGHRGRKPPAVMGKAREMTERIVGGQQFRVVIVSVDRG
jgi:hypothetical protein